MLDVALSVSVGVTVVQDHFAFADLISYFPVQNEASWGS
jgi:hypothetical protein